MINNAYKEICHCHSNTASDAGRYSTRVYYNNEKVFGSLPVIRVHNNSPWSSCATG